MHSTSHPQAYFRLVTLCNQIHRGTLSPTIIDDFALAFSILSVSQQNILIARAKHLTTMAEFSSYKYTSIRSFWDMTTTLVCPLLCYWSIKLYEGEGLWTLKICEGLWMSWTSTSFSRGLLIFKSKIYGLTSFVEFERQFVWKT